MVRNGGDPNIIWLAKAHTHHMVVLYHGPLVGFMEIVFEWNFPQLVMCYVMKMHMELFCNNASLA